MPERSFSDDDTAAYVSNQNANTLLAIGPVPLVNGACPVPGSIPVFLNHSGAYPYPVATLLSQNVALPHSTYGLNNNQFAFGWDTLPFSPGCYIIELDLELDVAVDANGKSFKLKSFKGKWLLVTVGAAWCKPCAKELPAWDKIAPDWKGKVQFVAIDLDDAIDDGKKFHKKLKLKNLSLVYMPSDKSAVADKYGADHMPTTALVDPQGVIRYVRGGFEKGDVDGEVKLMQEQLTKLVK